MLDAGVVVPPFSGDIVIRGGMSKCSVSNASDDAIKVKIWAVWADNGPPPGSQAALDSITVPLEWDPSILAEFSTFGKVLWSKEAILNPTATLAGNPFVLFHKTKPKKIDEFIWNGLSTGAIATSTPGGDQLYWFIGVSRYTGAGIENVQVTVSWSMSFAADAT